MSVKSFTRFLESRSCAIVMASVAVVLSLAFSDSGENAIVVPSQGLLAGESGQWFGNGALSWIFNIMALCGTVSLFTFINRQFKLIRSNTWYFVGLFFIVQLSFPPLFERFTASTILALTLTVCAILLFSTFSNVRSSQTVFLIFLLIGFISFWISAAAFFIFVFAFGMAQMRIFVARNVVAMILGLATPYWIAWGFEFYPLFELQWPDMDTSLSNVIGNYPLPMLVTLLAELVAALAMLISTTIKSLNYNAGRRAFNGFTELLGASLIVLVLIDSSNFLLYVTMLNLLLSFQAAHLFSTRKTDGGYLPMLILPAIFLGLAVWNYL